MKKLNFLMIALTMLMGITMTSCLNSDGENNFPDFYAVPARVNEFMGTVIDLELANGMKLVPTAVSVKQLKDAGKNVVDFDYVIVYAKTVKVEGKDNTNSKEVNVTLQDFTGCPDEDVEVVDSEQEFARMENAPFVPMSTAAAAVPFKFDNETLVVPVVFLTANDKKEYEKHKVNLVYKDFEDAVDNTMVLYLVHDNGGDTKTDALAGDFYFFELREALMQYQMKNGAAPAKVKVMVHESQNSEMPKDYKSYEVDFTK